MIANASANAVTPAVEDSAAAVVVRCHDLACALPIRFVSRLVLPGQLQVLEGSSLVYVDDMAAPFMAWDLGERLGMSRVDAAWALLAIPHGGNVISMALRTGPCLTVDDSLPPTVPLPASLFGQRTGAISSAFLTNAQHGGAAYGLVIDVQHLWSPSELVAASTMLQGRRK